MPRMIDAEALYEAVSDHVTTVSVCPTADWARGKAAMKEICLEDIQNAPTVDAAPVRHGHIDIKVINPYDGEDCYCSECNHWSLLPDYKWCPYCGAKFDASTCGPDYCEIGGGDDDT